jgi:hypothetical protein
MKRLLQLCYINEVTYAAACMLITSEIFKNRDDIKYAWYSVANNKFDDRQSTASALRNISKGADQDEEVFVDIDRLEDQNIHTRKNI